MKIDSARIETFLALGILVVTAVLFAKYHQPDAQGAPIVIQAPSAEAAK